MQITRFSPKGFKYTLSNTCHEREFTRIQLKVGTSIKEIVVRCRLDDLGQRWYNWQYRGFKIQEAFDNLNDDEREFLMTGITKEEWDQIFKDEDDNE